jgi:hypothetical protein
MRIVFFILTLILVPTFGFSTHSKIVEGKPVGEPCCFHNYPFDKDFLLKKGDGENGKPLPPKITHPLPFQVGEILFYEITFEKLIFSGKVGEMTLKAEKAENTKLNAIQLKGEIVSKGFFTSLFNLNFEQNLSSLVSADDLGVLVSSKIIDDGKTRREHTSQLNRDKGLLTHTYRNAKDPGAVPQTKEVGSSAWVQDILSIFYFARTQEWKEGATISFPVADEGNIRNIEIIVGKREEVKVDAGKFQAVMLEAKIFGGLFLRRSGEMFIWFSDDARRLPVKTKLKLTNGTVNIELKKLQ